MARPIFSNREMINRVNSIPARGMIVVKFEKDIEPASSTASATR
jgi:hypothetical protein